MAKIRRAIGIAALCALTGLGGFVLGKMTSIVDKVTVHQETPTSISTYKIIKLHKPYGQDELFVKRNGPSHWELEDCFGTYEPMEETLVNSYGQSTAEVLKKKIRINLDWDENHPPYAY